MSRRSALVLAVSLLAMVGCGVGQAPGSGSTPSKPQFEAVTTDWQWTPGPPSATVVCNAPPPDGICSRLPGPEVGTAHGIFKNLGATGSAVVTFSDDTGDSCTTVIPPTGTGQVAEASCPIGPIGRRTASPQARISSA